jgi:AraC family transcriptional activator of tynA and feaB
MRVQYWSDALVKLCGKFDVDALGASSLEGHVDYTTVSRLILCQIEVSQHRTVLPVSGVKTCAHPYVKMLFQTKGISYFERNGRRIELTPGDCLAYNVSLPHTIISPRYTQHEVVIVPTELLRERGFNAAEITESKLSARSGSGRIAHEFMRAAFGEVPKLSPRVAVRVADTLLDLVLLPLREVDAAHGRSSPAAVYAQAQVYIREHLRDPDLSIERISASLGYTKRYLHMIFSDSGITVSDYIWRARLQNCREELERAEARKSITDVAFSWGFSSSSHFSRVFRNYFGIVPSAILKAQRVACPGKPAGCDPA